MEMCTSLVYSVDPALGKIDYASLSQQTLMELLIKDIANKDKIIYSDENPEDISEWSNIEINDEGNVTYIDWENMALVGSINFQWLPPSVDSVDIAKNFIRGTFDTQSLPSNLWRILLTDIS